MKTLPLLALATALVGGISVASAQTAPTSEVGTSPASVNKGNMGSKPSGSEATSAATGTPQRVSGHGKFCKQATTPNALDCIYASMDACKKANKSDNLECVANPKHHT